MAPIETHDQFRRWLETQPQSVAVTIATRAALRWFPSATHDAGPDATRRSHALIAARCILTSGTAIKLQTSDIMASAQAAERAAIDALNGAARDTGNAAATLHGIRAAASAAGTATTGQINLLGTPVYADAERPLQELLTSPLWDRVDASERYIVATKQNPNILDSGPEWDFWRRWYQGFLIGAPLDWELQHRVALIDNAIWEAGPEAVAKEIEKIEAAFEVETKARVLQKSAYVSQPHARGMGDNNPPSALDDDFLDLPPVTIVWAGARELAEQAQSPTPDTGQIKKAIGAIAGVLKSCGLWIAGKLDKGITAAVVAAGGATGTAGVVWVTQNADMIHELINSAQRWLQLIE